MGNIKDGRHTKVIIGSLVFLMAIIGMVGISHARRRYQVKVDDKEIGIVKKVDDVEALLGAYEEDLKKQLGKDVKITNRISFEEVTRTEGVTMDRATISQALKTNLKVEVEAYALNVDNKDLVILEDDEEAKAVVKSFEKRYLPSGEVGKVQEIEFVEKVEIKPIFVPPEMISTLDEAIDYLFVGTEEQIMHEVKIGETAWDIALMYDLWVEDLEKANPDINLDKLQIGQEISVTVPKPLLNVKLVEEIQYKENMPYEVIYEETNALYQGDHKTKVKGKEGEKEITAEITKLNGRVIKEDIITETVLSEPKQGVVLKGTKERPKTMAYGSFANPSSGYLTSRYGARWGRQHEGIDIGMPTGTSVKASDGGRVVFAGWNSGYGNLVIIDHENGYRTYYAHNSSLKVKEGDRVYRGQVISLSGATGNVTGPHLHFEVRKNGTPIDPLKFISY